MKSHLQRFLWGEKGEGNFTEEEGQSLPREKDSLELERAEEEEGEEIGLKSRKNSNL